MKKSIKQNFNFIAIIPVMALLFSFVTWTSDSTPVVVNTSELQKDIIVYPEFKGGTEALMKYLKDNIKYPEKMKKAKIQGVVYVGFIVNKRGKIKKVKVKRKINKELEAEAIRTIKSMPRWIPGTKNGKRANIEMVLPIKFNLK